MNTCRLKAAKEGGFGSVFHMTWEGCNNPPTTHMAMENFYLSVALSVQLFRVITLSLASYVDVWLWMEKDDCNLGSSYSVQ